MQPLIAFVGAGNMASSIVGGLVAAGHPADRLRAADPFPESLQRLQEVAPISVFDDNASAVQDADIVVLAVKPQVMAEAADSIAAVNQGALILSIAAGITLESLQTRLGPQVAVVRCMPNTPALLGCGACGLLANSHCSQVQKKQAEQVMSAVGTTCWVNSEQGLDAVTALSGSGPAYFFRFLEAMIEAGVELGLPRETATALAVQTGYGASRMALESEVELAELRRRVTSPGGTTERALESFEEQGLSATVTTAMRAAFERAAEMAKEMG